MPLTPEQQQLRYTRQRIIGALEAEPYGYTSVEAARRSEGQRLVTEAAQAVIDVLNRAP